MQILRFSFYGMESFIKKFENHNGAKMVDVWNVNKLTEARIKMEVGKLRTKAAQ